MLTGYVRCWHFHVRCWHFDVRSWLWVSDVNISLMSDVDISGSEVDFGVRIWQPCHIVTTFPCQNMTITRVKTGWMMSECDILTCQMLTYMSTSDTSDVNLWHVKMDNHPGENRVKIGWKPGGGVTKWLQCHIMTPCVMMWHSLRGHFLTHRCQDVNALSAVSKCVTNMGIYVIFRQSPGWKPGDSQVITRKSPGWKPGGTDHPGDFRVIIGWIPGDHPENGVKTCQNVTFWHIKMFC